MLPVTPCSSSSAELPAKASVAGKVCPRLWLPDAADRALSEPGVCLDKLKRPDRGTGEPPGGIRSLVKGCTSEKTQRSLTSA